MRAVHVAVVGGYASARAPFDNAAFTAALRSWVEAGGGLVATGWTVYAAGPNTGTPIADIRSEERRVGKGSCGYYFGTAHVVAPVNTTNPITDGANAFSYN